MLRALHDALGRRANGDIDDDAECAAGSQHGGKKFILRSENAYVARRRHHGQLDGALSQQSEPPRKVAAQSAIDDVADHADTRTGPDRQGELMLLECLDQFPVEHAGPHRHQHAFIVPVKLDGFQVYQIQNHGIAAGHCGRVRRFVTSADASDRSGRR